MYHDEFAAKSVRRDPAAGAEDRLTGLALEVGGGVTLAMAASLLARPFLPALYDIAGMLPLAATSATILARRCVGRLEQVARRVAGLTPSAGGPVAPSILRGPSRRLARSKTAARIGPGRIG